MSERMRMQIAVGLAALSLVVAGCESLASRKSPTDHQCDAARSLGAAVAAGKAAMEASAAGDSRTAADRAEQADRLRQDGQAGAMIAAAQETQAGSGTPGFSGRMAELTEAQRAADLFVGVLRDPAAPVAAEARSRLLDDAEAKIRAIGLPASCTVIQAAASP